MSMTQVAFLKKDDLPSVAEIVNSIKNLGFDFRILDEISDLTEQDGLQCSINGVQTYFEIYLDSIDDITADQEWIKPDLNDEDLAISFIWGADYAAGACIGLISISLIDMSNALIYYLDDKMKYSRDMLIQDTPIFLGELAKTQKVSETISSTNDKTIKNVENNGFLSWIKNIFKQ